MPSFRPPVLAVAVALLSLAACTEKVSTPDDLRTRVVTLPGGRQILAEVVSDSVEMTRGMMFRDSLAEDRGMLFMHLRPGNYTYWMYQVRIPLDIIWMDGKRRVVEISANTPPCASKASECPLYGGKQTSQFVLELAGGMAARYGINVGDVLEF